MGCMPDGVAGGNTLCAHPSLKMRRHTHTRGGWLAECAWVEAWARSAAEPNDAMQAAHYACPPEACDHRSTPCVTQLKPLDKPQQGHRKVKFTGLNHLHGLQSRSLPHWQVWALASWERKADGV